MLSGRGHYVEDTMQYYSHSIDLKSAQLCYIHTKREITHIQCDLRYWHLTDPPTYIASASSNPDNVLHGMGNYQCDLRFVPSKIVVFRLVNPMWRLPWTNHNNFLRRSCIVAIFLSKIFPGGTDPSDKSCTLWQSIRHQKVCASGWLILKYKAFKIKDCALFSDQAML